MTVQINIKCDDFIQDGVEKCDDFYAFFAIAIKFLPDVDKEVSLKNQPNLLPRTFETFKIKTHNQII